MELRAARGALQRTRRPRLLKGCRPDPARSRPLPRPRPALCPPRPPDPPSPQPCQRRYILLVLWMARLGGGVLPGKSIVDAARRLRFS